VEIRYTIVPTTFGDVILAARSGRLVRLLLPAPPRHDPHTRAREALGRACYEPGLLPDLSERIVWYFQGRPTEFAVPIDLSGLTDFQRAVLLACRRIGYGQTSTYGQLARAIGRPRAARAVGAALARNPIPLVVPCHRVLRSDGALGGFTAEQGIELKRKMLRLEGAM